LVSPPLSLTDVSGTNNEASGPNATTYIIPAEVFPTRYRATCHGISAGAGKLGSILVQVFSSYYNFGTGPGTEPTIRHGWILIVFSACMILGAAVTHFWIPPVQRNAAGKSQFWGGRPQSLETLALGRLGWRSRYAVKQSARPAQVSAFSYELH
jgi:hypothetical protein